jgi:hypothetical protein
MEGHIFVDEKWVHTHLCNHFNTASLACNYIVEVDIGCTRSALISIGILDSLGCTRVSNLMSVQQGVLEMLSGQYYVPISSLTFDLIIVILKELCHLLLGYTSF